jgi:hypothetical protein
VPPLAPALASVKGSELRSRPNHPHRIRGSAQHDAVVIGRRPRSVDADEDLVLLRGVTGRCVTSTLGWYVTITCTCGAVYNRLG